MRKDTKYLFNFASLATEIHWLTVQAPQVSIDRQKCKINNLNLIMWAKVVYTDNIKIKCALYKQIMKINEVLTHMNKIKTEFS